MTLVINQSINQFRLLNYR